jgi:putative ABC transport system permease protein
LAPVYRIKLNAKTMLRHNLLIAYRNLKRHKVSFFINLVGLSTGLACTFLICLWVSDEWGFDKFHTKDSQLFQVMESSKENGNIIIHDNTQGLLASSMQKDLPEVESATPLMSLEKYNMFLPMRWGRKAVKSTGLFAGKDFFSTFSFPLIRGNAQQVLSDKNSIVISGKLAASLFGSVDNAIGKQVEWELLGQKKQSLVTGVFDKLPDNNSLKFDFALTYELLLSDIVPNFQKWGNEGPVTYLVIKKGTDIDKFNTKIAGFVKKYDQGSIYSLFVRPYSSAYLYGKYENGVQAGGRIGYVKLFSIIALFILLIACINFMNLSTAKAAERLKEVGIKKTMGSTRKALIFQFLSEAVCMALLSLFLGCLIVVALLPMFNEVTGKHLDLNFSPKIISVGLGIAILTGLLSGSYPAFYLSGFNPVSVLKGKLKNSLGEILARKGLVVFQFVVSLVLIVSVIIVYRQVAYIQSKNLGYDKDNILYFDKEGAIGQNLEAFLTGLKNIPGVKNASAIQQNIVQDLNGSSTYGIDWPGKTDKDVINFTVQAVDYNMIETLGLRFKEGRSFSPDFGSDDTKLIFNEEAIKEMGLKHPIGTAVSMWGKKMSIGGVVKDFHVTSLHEPIAPLVFRYNPDNTMLIMAKIEAGKEKETIDRIGAFYKTFNPGYVFEYKFLDEAYQAQYVSERRVSVLSRYFAGLAILISCLGLFGLAAFNAAMRTKEIGIRKILGASAGNVMVMLSKDFIKLVAIAIVIAFPLAWWATNAWLNTFIYHIHPGAGEFIIAGVSIIVFALLTVSYQSVRTAMSNPVESLRTY